MMDFLKDVMRPATYAEIVCIGGFVISWLIVCALMTMGV